MHLVWKKVEEEMAQEDEKPQALNRQEEAELMRRDGDDYPCSTYRCGYAGPADAVLLTQEA